MIRRLFPAWSGCMHGILGPCDAEERCLGSKGKRPPAGHLGSSFYNPEISDAVKESLIRLQLQRLKLLRHDGRSYEGEDLQKKSAGSWAFTTDRCSGCSGRSWRKPGRMMNPPSGRVKIPLFLNAPSKVCKLSAYRHSAICCARGKGKRPVLSGTVAEEGGYLPPLQAECQMRS